MQIFATKKIVCFFFKQKTAYEIYQCDWSSDVCSSDLLARGPLPFIARGLGPFQIATRAEFAKDVDGAGEMFRGQLRFRMHVSLAQIVVRAAGAIAIAEQFKC